MGTPYEDALADYLTIKRRYAGSLLFCRMGDFYELFNDDAVVAAKTLGITLTRRKHLGENIPMCGIPAHACDAYRSQLAEKGFRVVLCEEANEALDAEIT